MTENYLLVGAAIAGACAVAAVCLAIGAVLHRTGRPRGRTRRPRRVDLSMWTSTWESTNTDQWMAPLRNGGTRTERRIRHTLAERGLLLARRAGRRAERLRRVLAKGGRS
jgi:hypothetical protein